MKVLSVVILVLIGVLVISGLLYAEVTSENVKVDIDDNGNIRVYTAYYIDGVNFPTNYTKNGVVIDGKNVMVTRYSWQNFIGMTKEETLAYIAGAIKKCREGFIFNEYNKKTNTQLLIDLKDLENTIDVSQDTTIKVDTNKNGKPDKEYIVKTDGTKTEKDIEEVTINPIIK